MAEKMTLDPPPCRRCGCQGVRLVLVHTPSWLNQIEIYFSIVQRKVLTPNDFASLAEVADRLLRFQDLSRSRTSSALPS